MNVRVVKPVPGYNVTDNYVPVYKCDKTVGVFEFDKENSQIVSGQPAKNPFTST